jgi:hypothetical protein
MKAGYYNKFKLRGFLPDSSPRLDVKNTAEQLVGFISELTAVDDIFNRFELDRVKKTIDLCELGITGAVDELIKQIIESTDWWNGSPIQDRTRTPTVNSSRATGFQLRFNFKENNQKRFSIAGNISSDFNKRWKRELFLDNFNQDTDYLYPFSWYEAVLKTYVEYWNPSQVSIIYQSSDWLKMDVKTGIGRLSYFADDYDIPVPGDLKGVEYQKSENGRYLYVCTEIIPEKEAFLACEAKTVAVMNEWLERVPEYKKEKRS